MPINTCKIKISILNAHDEEQKNIEHNQGTVMKHGQEVINGDHSEGDNIKEKNTDLKMQNHDSKENPKKRWKN